MNAEKLKREIRKILNKEIKFNKEFKKHSTQLKGQEENLLSWCKQIKENKITPIPTSILKDEIIFIKKIGSTKRCIVIKIKNKEFKEIHLADHKYYDKLRKTLRLKKDSKTH